MVLSVLVVAALVTLKVWFMLSVWRMAKAQGKSPWLCVVASFFCAWIVFLALLVNGHSHRSQARWDAEREDAAL